MDIIKSKCITGSIFNNLHITFYNKVSYTFLWHFVDIKFQKKREKEFKKGKKIKRKDSFFGKEKKDRSKEEKVSEGTGKVKVR